MSSPADPESVEADIRTALRRYRPGPAVALRPLGPAGLFLSGRDLVVRHYAPASEVTRRAGLLEVAAKRSTLPVPRVEFADAALGVLGVRRLDGSPLVRAELTAHARPLADFLTRLHATPPGTVDRVVPRAPAADDDPAAWHVALLALRERRHADLTVATRAVLDRFLALGPPLASSDRAVAHLSLSQHVLVDGMTDSPTGVLGWGGLAIADPAREFAELLAGLGPAMFDAVLDGYRPDDTRDLRERAVFFGRALLLIRLGHALGANDRAAARDALRRFQQAT